MDARNEQDEKKSYKNVFSEDVASGICKSEAGCSAKIQKQKVYSFSFVFRRQSRFYVCCPKWRLSGPKRAQLDESMYPLTLEIRSPVRFY